ncbi:hypothetical protein [Gallibacterium genomosp. 3]|uniref:hypothetical protein n=1 Tax=Gallibacterium genomosp. 3 TaxID=505345 RepID=UPI0012E6F667|nr:hypothetical protein [Gallibacterium genomosp. 3]
MGFIIIIFGAIFTGSNYLRFYIEPSAKTLAYTNKVEVEKCGKSKRLNCYYADLIYQANGEVFITKHTDLTNWQAKILREGKGMEITYLVNQPTIIIHDGKSDKQYFWLFTSLTCFCIYGVMVYGYRKWKKLKSPA